MNPLRQSTLKLAPRERCVAVLDVLGFRDRIRQGDTTSLAMQLERLAKSAARANVTWSMASSDGDHAAGRERTHRFLFSDSIFLWSDPLPRAAVRRRQRIASFTLNVSSIMLGALASGLPLRAGLAFGEMIIDARRQVIVGQPVIDAYLTEGAQNWIGGALHSSFPCEPMAHAVAYDVPTNPQAEFELLHALDWVLPAYIGSRAEKDAILHDCETYLDAEVERFDGTHIAEKYRNCRDFLHSQRARYDAGYEP